MKVTYPLSLKVSLWLLLNLLLLAGAGVTAYWVQFGRGWDSLITGALGQRLQATGDNLAAEIHTVGPTAADALLAERSAQTGAQFFLFHNDGRQLAGQAVTLPEQVRVHLMRGPRRGGPPELGGRGFGRGPGDGEPRDFGSPGDRSLAFASRRMEAGRFVLRTADPAATWLALRVPVLRPDGPPGPGTLVIRAPSLASLLRVLDVLPLFGLLAAAFVLSVVFWLPLVGGITRALRRLDAATEAIADGRFDTRVPANRRDELGRLGESVNRMAARLDTLVSGQKRFLGDIAHELGSPLGRLQVATEILESRADPALQPAVADVREEVQQMATLVNELLAFTKAGLRPREAELAVVGVDALVDEVLGREDPAGRVQRRLTTGLSVRADPLLLGRALGNLVRNSLRYAGNEAVVTVAASKEDGYVLLSVDDTGPGVPAAALPRLGEPFFRPELARTREGGGIGLGLAIVRSSVAACGGEVQFSNLKPVGFRAQIRLPAA